MSYDSWLEGMVALEPAPDAEVAGRLRRELAALGGDGREGRLVLSPMGAGFVVEAGFDWERSLALIERARESVLAGHLLVGRLTARGEDDAILAHVRYEAGAPILEIVEADGDDDDDTASWVASLEDADDEVKLHIIALLGSREPELVVGPLAALAVDDDADFRRAALESLGELGPEALGARAAIETCLADSDPLVRYWATHAAGRLGRHGAPLVAKLEALTNDAVDGPRYGAIDALKRIRASG